MKNALGEEEVVLDKWAEESDAVEIEGWDYKYKLQDFSMVKHLSSQFTSMFKPLLDHVEFFEAHYDGNREAVMSVLAADDAPSDVYAFKGKM